MECFLIELVLLFPLGRVEIAGLLNRDFSVAWRSWPAKLDDQCLLRLVFDGIILRVSGDLVVMTMGQPYHRSFPFDRLKCIRDVYRPLASCRHQKVLGRWLHLSGGFRLYSILGFCAEFYKAMDIEKRLDIERELLLALEQTKAHYRALLCEAAQVMEIIRDVGISSDDGRLSLKRNIEMQHALMVALEAYDDALHRFSDFVLRGKLPKSTVRNWQPCEERDRLFAEFETALDAYTQAGLKLTVTTDVTEMAGLHASLQDCRMSLHDHCQQHGCNPLAASSRA